MYKFLQPQVGGAGPPRWMKGGMAQSSDPVGAQPNQPPYVAGVVSVGSVVEDMGPGAVSAWLRAESESLTQGVG